MEDRYRLHVAATPWSGDWLDPELSTHGYAMIRLNGGVHRNGFGAWLSFAYVHDFEDKSTARLNSNKFVFEPALRYKYRSFTVYAGLNRVVDTETFGDLKRFKDYNPQSLVIPYLQTSCRLPPCAPTPGTRRK